MTKCYVFVSKRLTCQSGPSAVFVQGWWDTGASTDGTIQWYTALGSPLITMSESVPASQIQLHSDITSKKIAIDEKRHIRFTFGRIGWMQQQLPGQNDKVWKGESGERLSNVSDLRGVCPGLAFFGCSTPALAECIARRRILWATGRREPMSFKSDKLPSLSVSRSLPVKSTELSFITKLKAGRVRCNSGLEFATK